MNKKPYINALLAEAYIVALVLTIMRGPHGVEPSIVIPIMMLSVFVLSAALMGYLFLSKPLQLYLDGDKKEAVTFFMHTVAAFAGITLFVFILWAILLA
jgi:hypothetical protein